TFLRQRGARHTSRLAGEVVLNDSAQAVFRPEPSQERIKQGRIGSVYWIVGKTIIADFTQHALLVAHHLEYRQTHLPGPGFQTTHDEHLFALRVLRGSHRRQLALLRLAEPGFGDEEDTAQSAGSPFVRERLASHKHLLHSTLKGGRKYFNLDDDGISGAMHQEGRGMRASPQQVTCPPKTDRRSKLESGRKGDRSNGTKKTEQSRRKHRKTA